MKRRKLWTDYPKRFCRSWHRCALCDGNIYLGQWYYDGGFGRRVHVDCAHNAIKHEVIK